ncbi:hypothetical protein FHS44_001768 [Streptosporangium saharense]|uniref:Uncharacterized protein n=1 Tax=Streptosporangium saharense TaxID=1706840 RepID=A0A7W7QKF6_9ACTN|nr:hypothetical protein [Streptosporangium saharense]
MVGTGPCLDTGTALRDLPEALDAVGIVFSRAHPRIITRPRTDTITPRPVQRPLTGSPPRTVIMVTRQIGPRLVRAPRPERNASIPTFRARDVCPRNVARPRTGTAVIRLEGGIVISCFVRRGFPGGVSGAGCSPGDR